MNVLTFSNEIYELYQRADYPFSLSLVQDWDDKKLREADALICGRATNEQIDLCPKLKSIFIPFTGRNGFDEKYLESKNINLVSTNAHSKFVAERAVSLTLTFLGRILEYDTKLKENLWSRRNFSDRIAWDTLFGKRVGIYGYGTIGKWIAKLLSPFNCEVYAFNRSRNEDVNYLESIEELIEHSDIVYICAPLTNETRSIFNKELLSKMEDKLLVNISRGAIVDEDALYEALNSQKLYGYASDVWFNYPKAQSDVASPSKYPLNEQRVLMTPHCGGFTKGAKEGRYLDILSKVGL